MIIICIWPRVKFAKRFFFLFFMARVYIAFHFERPPAAAVALGLHSNSAGALVSIIL